MDPSYDPGRRGMESDYFAGPGGQHRDSYIPRTPFPLGFEPELINLDSPHRVDELVRRTNLNVQMVNGHITRESRYAQIQPKMCSDGKFPQDFRTARTVEEFRLLDSTALERILQAYHLPPLPMDNRAVRLHRESRSPVQHYRLITLYDYLGATSLAESERHKVGLRHTIL
ncbi:hypothetical protein M501DRAFT_994048 [Patellaria atrata CBS 101060]|uniref:Uncharacterized protein n=1 Tax=Patellaria atrata CBS 101060 TaxID=1346257 RepID=A0A9P4SIY9_9PEZI|nr:hypothetical protein M501DRAFT_994048 [Patellaria atrata CBS 101060]